MQRPNAALKEGKPVGVIKESEVLTLIAKSTATLASSAVHQAETKKSRLTETSSYRSPPTENPQGRRFGSAQLPQDRTSLLKQTIAALFADLRREPSCTTKPLLTFTVSLSTITSLSKRR